MAFWAGYRAALKPLDIEEPIDVYVHRPAGYVIAKLCFHTPVTPNQLTLGAILLGITGGVLLAVERPYHLQLGALCLFLSTAFDCADGMLARMRKTSSAFGRMLDGLADLFTISGAIIGTVAVMIRHYDPPRWHAAIAVALSALTVFTSSFHTTGYDHYKNVYMRFTIPGSKEGDELSAAQARYEEARARRPMGPVGRLMWWIYLNYLKAQQDWISGFDPFTTTRLDALPPYDEARAAVYKKHAYAPMRLWRYFFGVGSMMIGFTVSNAFGRPDIFLLWRLVILNGIFHLYLKPLQRQASQRAFAELGISQGAPA